MTAFKFCYLFIEQSLNRSLMSLLIVILFFSCKKDNSSMYFEFEDVELLKIVKEYQKQNIPNNDKIILIELYRNVISNPILFLTTIEHPNDVVMYDQCFFIYKNDLIVFYHSPAFSYFNFKIDKSEVNRIIKQKYKNIDIDAEYDVDMSDEALSGGWYVIWKDSSSYGVFNMTDSIRLYGDVNCQYNKLEKFIDPFCDCCECD